MKPVVTAARQVSRHDIVRVVRQTSRLVRRMSWLPAFVVVLLGWQAGLLFALLVGWLHPAAYVAIHIAGCLALAACLWRLNASTKDDRYSAALQMVAWSALAGPFGAFVAAAIALPSQLRSSALHDTYTDDVAADTLAIGPAERMHIALLDRRVRIEGASRINPLMDVIADGAQAEKLEALGVSYRKYEARLSAVLRRGLQDSDASVRVLAATVMSKLHAKFTAKLGDCQTEAAAKPTFAENWRNLAEARMAYAESGLLEASRAHALIETAVEDLSRATEIDPADQAVIGRLSLARRQLSARRA